MPIGTGETMDGEILIIGGRMTMLEDGIDEMIKAVTGTEIVIIVREETVREGEVRNPQRTDIHLGFRTGA